MVEAQGAWEVRTTVREDLSRRPIEVSFLMRGEPFEIVFLIDQEKGPADMAALRGQADAALDRLRAKVDIATELKRFDPVMFAIASLKPGEHRFAQRPDGSVIHG